MKRYSLNILFWFVLGIFIIVNSVFIYFSLIYHRQALIESIVKEKVSIAETIGETISLPVWHLQAEIFPVITLNLIKGMATSKDTVFIRIVNPDGSIELSNIKEEWGRTVEDLDRLTQVKEITIKDGAYKGEKIKMAIYPIFQGKTIWVGFTLKEIEKMVWGVLIRDIFILGGGLILIILFLFSALRFNIINPLKRIITVCQEIRKGNLDVKIDVKSKTEIGELADTFNEMIRDLRQSHIALEEAKIVLEIKVKARTKELKELAESLDEQVKERTQELQKRIEQLEKFHRLTVGRELKMIELKKEIEKLQKELKKSKS